MLDRNTGPDRAGETKGVDDYTTTKIVEGAGVLHGCLVRQERPCEPDLNIGVDVALPPPPMTNPARIDHCTKHGGRIFDLDIPLKQANGGACQLHIFGQQFLLAVVDSERLNGASHFQFPVTLPRRKRAHCRAYILSRA